MPPRVELFHKGKRVASHARSFLKGRFTTVNEHMPESHRFHAEWSPERFLRWAGKIGPSTVAVIEAIFANRRHLEQGYRACLGILRLAKCYKASRLEAACRRAIALRAFSYTHIANILKHGGDRIADAGQTQDLGPVRPTDHENIRGSQYFSDEALEEILAPDASEVS